MKKAKHKPILIGGRDPISQLYRAVLRYVEASGGQVIVIGGVQVQEWQPRSGNYVIGIKCMGKLPKFTE